MAHHSRVAQIVIDVAPGDHDREVAFWQGATGRPLTRAKRYPEYHTGSLPGTDVGLLLQRLGARRVREVEGWWIMQDPAGLLFCVVPEEPGALSEANAHRWD